MKTAFIFDLDGTLLDSMGIWETIGADYLTARNITNFPEDLAARLKTMSLMEAAEYFIAQYALPQSPQAVCDDINAFIADKYVHSIAIKPGVREFLHRHRDKKMCVATATDRHLVEAALHRLELDGYFSFILTSGEVGNSKQYPDIYLQAAQGLGVPIAQCVVFEDALHAMETAKKAGFYTVAVYEPVFAAEADAIRQTADQFVTQLGETIL